MQLNAWLLNIAERMQAASFSPNSIERMTRELADHHQDILAASATDGSNDAITRLGTVDSILDAAEQQRIGSMAWFHFLILPLLQLVFVWVALAVFSLFVVNLFAMVGVNANQASSPMLIRGPLGLLWSGVPIWAVLFVSCRAYRRTVGGKLLAGSYLKRRDAEKQGESILIGSLCSSFPLRFKKESAYHLNRRLLQKSLYA